jgi:hypothetical protein
MASERDALVVGCQLSIAGYPLSNRQIIYAKASLACGSMVLFFFMYIVFAPVGENNIQAPRNPRPA